MTDTPPKPKRRRWRWLVVAALIVTLVVVGLAVRSAVKRSHQGRWIAAVEGLGMRTQLTSWFSSFAPPDGYGDMLLKALQGPELGVTVSSETDAQALLDLKGESPDGLKIFVVETVPVRWQDALEERYPSAEVFTLGTATVPVRTVIVEQ